MTHGLEFRYDFVINADNHTAVAKAAYLSLEDTAKFLQIGLNDWKFYRQSVSVPNIFISG